MFLQCQTKFTLITTFSGHHNDIQCITGMDYCITYYNKLFSLLKVKQLSGEISETLNFKK